MGKGAFIKPKRVLVTGGAGFIGTSLCHALLQNGTFVVCLDNYCTGSQDNIRMLEKHSNFEFIHQDVSSTLDILVDEIYHLACPASPRHYLKDPLATLKTILTGSENVLELAKRNQAKILCASTSEIYGHSTTFPQQETDIGLVNTTGERACYAEGKRCMETMFFAYQRQYGLPIKVARIFNTYGPYMSIDDGRVVSNFIVQALRNQPITVYGDGTQTRSFCFITDLVRGLIALLATPSETTGPINIGNPNETTVRELALQIIKLTGSASNIRVTALPEDDPNRRKPDISLAKNLLHWKPTVSFGDGLRQTIAYFEQLLNTSQPNLEPVRRTPIEYSE